MKHTSFQHKNVHIDVTLSNSSDPRDSTREWNILMETAKSFKPTENRMEPLKFDCASLRLPTPKFAQFFTAAVKYSYLNQLFIGSAAEVCFRSGGSSDLALSHSCQSQVHISFLCRRFLPSAHFFFFCLPTVSICQEQRIFALNRR